MKRALTIVLVLLLSSIQFIHAQILTPVKWSWKSEQIAKGEYKLIFTATIEKGWHTYSQFIAPDGPVPTAFKFTTNKDVQVVGKTTETGPKVHSGHDPVFDMELKYYEERLVCEQIVKVANDTKLKGTIEYMVCDDSRCLPPDEVEFEFDLSSGKSGIKVEWDTTSRGQNTTPAVISNTSPDFDSAVQAAINHSMAGDTTQQAGTIPADGANKYGEPLGDCAKSNIPPSEGLTLWLAILLGFGGGLVALVTPCVFPMIPLTVSFFLKRSEDKSKAKFDALFYSFCIVGIYFLLSLPFVVFNVSSDTLSEISTGAPLNIFFFFIFVFFAFSFFGYYEITLPSFIANKADSASNISGMVGIFFMAVTLAIVSFSCTGPILGTLIVSAAQGGAVNLMAGMTAFGLALALPFGVFALFPNLMKSLPKSGGWLNSVKVILGFVELIFALKFLSNADLVSHWGFLKREVFLGIWILLGAGAFLYLIGWVRFPHDSPLKKLAPVRALTAVVALAFTVYCSYGFLGNDLKLFSGFPPPKFYSIFETKSAIEPIKNDYAAAIAKAKAENKMVMLDFTGWACVNCRKMEENVWADMEVKKRLTENYVIVSLYVDDKAELPASEQYLSTVPAFNGKKIKTVGNKFSEMQAKYFGANSQPYYVLISPEEKLLATPRGYTPDAAEYVNFLDCGWNSGRQLSSR